MEKKKIPNTVLIAFAILAVLHLIVSKGEGIMGHYVLFTVPATAVLMFVSALGYAVSLFICYEKEARKKLYYVLAVLMVLLCIAPGILGTVFAMDLVKGPVTKEGDFYTIGSNCIFLNESKDTIAIGVTGRQQKYLEANEPPKNVDKVKNLESGVSIFAHEEKLRITYYERTGIAKSFEYIRNKEEK